MSTEGGPIRTRSGFTLIELIVSIVIVSVGLLGILSVLNITLRGSADPLVKKQLLAIAESLLEEVQAMPFTYCDPNDPNVTTATAASTGVGPDYCSASAYVETLGPEVISGVSQVRVTTGSEGFNNVNDYYVSGTGLEIASQITDITGDNKAPAGYSATIQIVPEGLNGISSTSSVMNVLRINVVVTNGAERLVMEGYRTRHSPNFSP